MLHACPDMSTGSKAAWSSALTVSAHFEICSDETPDLHIVEQHICRGQLADETVGQSLRGRDRATNEQLRISLLRHARESSLLQARSAAVGVSVGRSLS